MVTSDVELRLKEAQTRAKNQIALLRIRLAQTRGVRASSDDRKVAAVLCNKCSKTPNDTSLPCQLCAEIRGGTQTGAGTQRKLVDMLTNAEREETALSTMFTPELLPATSYAGLSYASLTATATSTPPQELARLEALQAQNRRCQLQLGRTTARLASVKGDADRNSGCAVQLLTCTSRGEQQQQRLDDLTQRRVEELGQRLRERQQLQTRHYDQLQDLTTKFYELSTRHSHELQPPPPPPDLLAREQQRELDQQAILATVAQGAPPQQVVVDLEAKLKEFEVERQQYEQEKQDEINKLVKTLEDLQQQQPAASSSSSSSSELDALRAEQDKLQKLHDDERSQQEDKIRILSDQLAALSTTPDTGAGAGEATDATYVSRLEGLLDTANIDFRWNASAPDPKKYVNAKEGLQKASTDLEEVAKQQSRRDKMSDREGFEWDKAMDIADQEKKKWIRRLHDTKQFQAEFNTAMDLFMKSHNAQMRSATDITLSFLPPTRTYAAKVYRDSTTDLLRTMSDPSQTLLSDYATRHGVKQLWLQEITSLITCPIKLQAIGSAGVAPLPANLKNVSDSDRQLLDARLREYAAFKCEGDRALFDIGSRLTNNAKILNILRDGLGFNTSISDFQNRYDGVAGLDTTECLAIMRILPRFVPTIWNGITVGNVKERQILLDRVWARIEQVVDGLPNSDVVAQEFRAPAYLNPALVPVGPYPQQFTTPPIRFDGDSPVQGWDLPVLLRKCDEGLNPVPDDITDPRDRRLAEEKRVFMLGQLVEGGAEGFCRQELGVEEEKTEARALEIWPELQQELDNRGLNVFDLQQFCTNSRTLQGVPQQIAKDKLNKIGPNAKAYCHALHGELPETSSELQKALSDKSLTVEDLVTKCKDKEAAGLPGMIAKRLINDLGAEAQEYCKLLVVTNPGLLSGGQVKRVGYGYRMLPYLGLMYVK